MIIIEIQGGLGNQLFLYVYWQWMTKTFPQDTIYGFYPARALAAHNGLEIEKWFDVNMPKSSIFSNGVGVVCFWLNKVFRRLQLPMDIPICLFDVTDSFGKRNPWSGVKDQAKILNRFGTFRYYYYCFKELIFVKPKNWCASHFKLLIKLINKNAYNRFLKRHGWQLINQVTDADWGIVNQKK